MALQVNFYKGRVWARHRIYTLLGRPSSRAERAPVEVRCAQALGKSNLFVIDVVFLIHYISRLGNIRRLLRWVSNEICIC